jgi:predicted phosphodiesterase
MRVGIISDLHLPFSHVMYLRFVQDVFQAWRVNRVVFIGDIVDHHAISFHEHDADGLSAGDEFDASLEQVAVWRDAFPSALTCIGNHCARGFRMASKCGLPSRYLKGYSELFETPKWKWELEHKVDGVIYNHGTGCSGKKAAYNLAIQRRMSVVIGHLHSNAGVDYHTNTDSRIFGMSVGCGLDIGAYSFAYSKHSPVRPVLGAGVVIDGEMAVFVPMACSPGEKYHRARAKRRKAA